MPRTAGTRPIASNRRLGLLVGLVAAHAALVGLVVAMPGEIHRLLRTESLVTYSFGWKSSCPEIPPLLRRIFAPRRACPRGAVVVTVGQLVALCGRANVKVKNINGTS